MKKTKIKMQNKMKIYLLAAISCFLVLGFQTSSTSLIDSAEKNIKPLERDIKVGYLLNYFFMSPKPYSWKKEEIHLSGWEVDKSGGTFSYSPEYFAFNIDWFMLEDISETKPVSISHQIAI
jgi:hypothetical protein